MSAGIEVLAKPPSGSEGILSPEALGFLESLHRTFEPTRRALLAARVRRQEEFDHGTLPGFPAETETVRKKAWRVASTPKDLEKRWVEITGPVERKMMINALNSGASVFMADFEDSLSPTWSNVVVGQSNLIDAVRRTIEHVSPEGKAYRLNDTIATLLVRPRGWHLPEKHVSVDGEPISASLFDFGLYVFHNARERVERGTAPYFYLPKMQSHKEARLWNEVFVFSQDALKIPNGTFRATVLIETLPAAFEMEEILYELREHSSGLNAGRWDYLFSTIKTMRRRRDLVLPDRVQLTMTVPFMRAYTELLVETCHQRGAHAMGGMAPFIPEPQGLADQRGGPGQSPGRQAARVRGTASTAPGSRIRTSCRWPWRSSSTRWGRGPTRRIVCARRCRSTASSSSTTRVPGGSVTEAGLRNNVNVGAPVPELLARRQRRRGDLQSDGRRRDGRDLPLPALAVDSQRARLPTDGR